MGLQGNFYADGSYQNDYVVQVTVPTTSGGQYSFPMPTKGDGSQAVQWRSVKITDVTALTGGTANAKISAYFRLDGHAPIEALGAAWTQANGGDGSFARILPVGGSVTINRFGTAFPGPITFLNGGANPQVLLLEFGA